jgi:hypothetical protein
MNPHDSPEAVSPSAAGYQAPDITIPVLVGKIYDAAPITERCRLLEHLMKPLGALALVGVCNGTFAKIWFRSGWQNLHIRPEDAQTVQGIDVISCGLCPTGQCRDHQWVGFAAHSIADDGLLCRGCDAGDSACAAHQNSSKPVW